MDSFEKLALAERLRGMFSREPEPSSVARNTGLAVGAAGGGLLGGSGGLFGHDFLHQALLSGDHNTRMREIAMRHPNKMNTLQDLAQRFGRLSMKNETHALPRTFGQILLRLARAFGTPGRMAALGAGALGLGGAGVLGGVGAGIDRLRN